MFCNTYRYLAVVKDILDDQNEWKLDHHEDATNGGTETVRGTHVLYRPSDATEK